MASRSLAVDMSHALRGKVTFVHSLCAVLARSATIFVDALGLAFATTNACAARPEGG